LVLVASGGLIPVRIGDIEIDVEAVQVAGTEATAGRAAKVAGMTAEAYARAQDVIVEVARTTAQMIDRAAERAARPDWLEVKFGLRFSVSGGVIMAGASAEASLHVTLGYHTGRRLADDEPESVVPLTEGSSGQASAAGSAGGEPPAEAP
jgi:Trypsin-co-occurring domain 1